MYDLIIIGGGAAGMFAAANASGLRTLVVDGSETVLKKLMISGSGMCNFTHSGDMDSFLDKYGEKKNFVKKALKSFDNTSVIEWFKSKGVGYEVRENGKVFPKSKSSSSIADVLIESAVENGVRILTKRKIAMVSNDGGVFSVVSENGEAFESRALLVSTGGKSFKGTGSDGSGYSLASMLGHNIVSPRPCLAPVYFSVGEDKYFKELAGTAFEDISVIHVDEFGKTRTLKGEMVITHKGFSGPLVLDASRYFKSGQSLFVNYHKDELASKAFDDALIDHIRINGKQKVVTMLRNESKTRRIGDYISESLSISHDLSLSEMSKSLRKDIVASMTRHEYRIAGMGSFDVAMATAGGVDTSEVVSSSMKSKILDGLYFSGEVLDIDGDTGGYNIQWAFSSAFAAVKAIRKL